MSDFDYVVVGSGAGGGPVAANLAKRGFKVLLLEAGGDPCSEDDMGRLMYEVPIFHGNSTEYPPCAWNYFVRHYSSDAEQAKDLKAEKINGRDVVWYPRAGTLGGCTAHNAMITVVPQDGDWNAIAQETGDASWGAAHMREYFVRLENCKYVPATQVAAVGEALAPIEKVFDRVESTLGRLLGTHSNWPDWSHGHGFNGWLPTSESDPLLVLKDPELLTLLIEGVRAALHDHLGNPVVGIGSWLDPNDSRNGAAGPEGLAFTPLAVDKGKRAGPRDYLLRVQKATPENLTIQKHALATKIIFDGNRAVGVEYIDHAHVHRADPAAVENPAVLPRTQVRAKQEVIVACGAFNSPQLLMLSGVGPRAQLEKFGIPVIADLPGVGANLQDRYEVAVVSRFARDFALLDKATFSPAPVDPYLAEWEKAGQGLYTSNGALIGIIKRSHKDLPDPDLYIFGLPGYFSGYKQGYSKEFERFHNQFTWAVLKARTRNTGRVELSSANAWDQPSINFQYFGDGARANDPDLEAVLDGVHFARSMNHRLAELGLIQAEEVPGPAIASDDQLREHIRTQAWGHHASCTNKIGADKDPLAVLDSQFRVRGTKGLRVVDASVFPRIPGYFIVTAIYVAAEKASDVIAASAM